MTVEDVIAAHVGAELVVSMYGFAPGFAYLSGLPEAIRVPRKPAALRDIPAGSIIIAGQQCLVTSIVMPTGWSIIGRSPTEIIRPDSDKPFRFDVGDRVVFRQVGPEALA
jgi:inhibitor of KinA